MKTSTDETLHVIQLSDTHLMDSPSQTLGGVNTQETLTAVIADILLRKINPDMILITGDLSQNGAKASYQRLAKTLAHVPCKVYYIPGNHDDTDEMNQWLYSKNSCPQNVILGKYWQIILLDSTAPGLEDGFLAEVDFTHLEYALQKKPKHFTIIAIHHPPLPVGAHYMDEIRLINSEVFLTKIKYYPQIKAVLFGHVHQIFEAQIADVQFLSAPSTAIQFLPNSKKFAIDHSLTPGYRWLELKKDGSLLTGINRIAVFHEK